MRRPVALALLLAGCANMPGTVKYKPKKRVYEESASSTKAPPELSPGSLWQDGRATLFSDMRAMRENDVVVVRVIENANAQRSNGTDMTRSTSGSSALSGFLQAAGNASGNSVGATGSVGGSGPTFAGQAAGSSQSAFTGKGNSQRSEQLTATVPAMVRKVLNNGNLFIEGHRVILVNNEEHHFYISGVVRPIDIDQANSVMSSMIADAEIEFTGQGDLTENARKGWFQRFLGWLWPF